MNDTNRLMLAVGVGLLIYVEYSASWGTIGLVLLFVSASSEAIRQTREGVEYFSQMMDQD